MRCSARRARGGDHPGRPGCAHGASDTLIYPDEGGDMLWRTHAVRSPASRGSPRRDRASRTLSASAWGVPSPVPGSMSRWHTATSKAQLAAAASLVGLGVIGLIQLYGRMRHPHGNDLTVYLF